MTRPRVVVAGLGDTGLLTAIHLSRHYEVVGISAKPGLVSGQELGNRISRPAAWARDYWISFDRYRRLDRVRVLHATLVGADLDARTVTVTDAHGRTDTEPYDVLVIATGVRNGFWRTPDLETAEQVGLALRDVHDRIADAGSVAVVGGGAAAVSAAGNIAATWPEKAVDLYFPGVRALPKHHPGVWARVERELRARGVGLHPGHRADVPAADACDRLTRDPVRWTTGQAPTRADAVVWAIGRVHPNTGWLPADVLDDRGFVAVSPDLRVVGHPDVFAIGDVAATDRLRSSARNRADKLLARNVRAHLAGRALRDYRPPRRRWGSVLGIQDDGLRVFTPAGWSFRFPGWTIRLLLEGLIVRWGIYRGVRAGPESVVPARSGPDRTISR